MAKPHVHAASSARKFGGMPSDYIEIHDFLDSSKGCVADNRHRMALHNAFTLQPNGVLEKVFGKTIRNSDGKDISVRSIGEQHMLEDFGGFIPTLQDYAMAMTLEPWMAAIGAPPSTTGHSKQKNSPLTLDGVMAEVSQWAAETFPNRTLDSVTEHLAEEMHELAQEPSSAEELADVVMLIFELAEMYGIDMRRAIKTKLEVCKKAEWRDDGNGVYHRIKRPEESTKTFAFREPSRSLREIYVD